MSPECCKTENKKKLPQKLLMGIDPFILGTIVITVALIIGVVYLGSKAGGTAEVSADTQVETQIGETRHDWGTIPINGGIVSRSFPIENTGSSPLKLYDVKTSCMCTTAQLTTSDQTSKKFGMHEKGFTVFEVAPGETAELLVEFDPAFHGPSGVGPISRTVTMSTNDASQPTLSFNLAANVVRE